MKKFLKVTFLFVSMLFITSCSSDDNNNGNGGDDNNNGGSSLGSFIIGGETYQVDDATITSFILNDGTSDSAISLAGMNGEKIGAITFRITHNTADGLAGNYVSDENSWDVIEGTYHSWLSYYSINEGNDLVTSNEPIGSVKIVSHGNNQYTLEFDVTYTDDVVASGNVTTTFDVYTMTFD